MTISAARMTPSITARIEQRGEQPCPNPRERQRDRHLLRRRDPHRVRRIGGRGGGGEALTPQPPSPYCPKGARKGERDQNRLSR